MKLDTYIERVFAVAMTLVTIALAVVLAVLVGGLLGFVHLSCR
jgi:hypothetical protein